MSPEEIAWHLVDEAVRGFFFEKHIPLDTADQWTEELVALVREQLEYATRPTPAAQYNTGSTGGAFLIECPWCGCVGPHYCVGSQRAAQS